MRIEEAMDLPKSYFVRTLVQKAGGVSNIVWAAGIATRVLVEALTGPLVKNHPSYTCRTQHTGAPPPSHARQTPLVAQQFTQTIQIKKKLHWHRQLASHGGCAASEVRRILRKGGWS